MINPGTTAAFWDETVVKAADQNVISSTVFVNDTHLKVAMGANETWVGLIWLVWEYGVGNPYIKTRFTVPAGGEYTYNVDDRDGGYDGADWTSNVSAAEKLLTLIRVWAKTGATAGDLQFQWAQSVSVADNTTVYAGSYFIAKKIAG